MCVRVAPTRRQEDIIYTHSMRDKVKFERKYQPGPGEYDRPPTPPKLGGQWGDVVVKSALDLEIERAAKVPAPGDYDLPAVALRTDKGVPWGDFVPKTMMEATMEAAAKLPGPGEYDVRPKGTGPVIQFDESEHTTYLDRILLTAKETPGPGAYTKKLKPVTQPKLRDIEKSMKQRAKELGITTVRSPLKNGKVRGRTRPPIPM